MSKALPYVVALAVAAAAFWFLFGQQGSAPPAPVATASAKDAAPVTPRPKAALEPAREVPPPPPADDTDALEVEAARRCAASPGGEVSFRHPADLGGEVVERSARVECDADGSVVALRIVDQAGRPLRAWSRAEAARPVVTRFAYDEQGRETEAATDLDGDDRIDREVRTAYAPDGVERRVERRFAHEGDRVRTVLTRRETRQADGRTSIVTQQRDRDGAAMIQHHDGNGDGVPDTIVRTDVTQEGARTITSLRDTDGDGVFDRRSVVVPPAAPVVEKIERSARDAGVAP